jgi:probable addiction module antidote protein
MRRGTDYKADLLSDLRSDKEYAALYLSAAYADSVESFLVALRNVAEAQKGIAKVAAKARINRENLYRMLSAKGNPQSKSLSAVLKVLGYRVIFEADSVRQPSSPVGGCITQENQIIAVCNTKVEALEFAAGVGQSVGLLFTSSKSNTELEAENMQMANRLAAVAAYSQQQQTVI